MIELSTEARMQILENKVDMHIEQTQKTMQDLFARQAELIIKIDQLKVLFIKAAIALGLITTGGGKMLDFLV